MTIHVNIGEAKTRLSALIAAAKRGEDVVIDRNGAPEVRLVPVDPEAHRKVVAARRRAFLGCWAGKVDDSGIDWFAPMSDEELAEWYDAPIFPPEDDATAA